MGSAFLAYPLTTDKNPTSQENINTATLAFSGLAWTGIFTNIAYRLRRYRKFGSGDLGMDKQTGADWAWAEHINNIRGLPTALRYARFKTQQNRNWRPQPEQTAGDAVLSQSGHEILRGNFTKLKAD